MAVQYAFEDFFARFLPSFFSFLCLCFDLLSPYVLFFLFSFSLILFFLKRFFFPYSDRLTGLSLAREGKVLGFSFRPFGVEFKNVRPDLLTTSYWRQHLEVFGHVFDRKFVDARIVSRRSRPHVQLLYDLLPETVPFAKCPSLHPMETWCGKNQFAEDVLIDLQNSPGVYIDGRPGSGKTLAILALFESFLKGVGGVVELLVVTTKPADYFYLRKKDTVKLTLIDIFSEKVENQINVILFEMEKIVEAERAFREVIEGLEEIDPDIMNLEALRQSGMCGYVVRKFFIFDEAKDYLSKNKADSKDVAEAKQKLVSAVYTHLRRTARFLSMPVIVASQTQSESDLDIPLKVFHLRLASSTSEAMSRIICGDTRLTDPSFTRGKFFIRTEACEHVVRVPLIGR